MTLCGATARRTHYLTCHPERGRTPESKDPTLVFDLHSRIKVFSRSVGCCGLSQLRAARGQFLASPRKMHGPAGPSTRAFASLRMTILFSILAQFHNSLPNKKGADCPRLMLFKFIASDPHRHYDVSVLELVAVLGGAELACGLRVVELESHFSC